MKSNPIVSDRCKSWWCGTNLKEKPTFPMGTITVDAKNNTFALEARADDKSTKHRTK